MQHQGSQSEFLRACLDAAHGARRLAAHAIGSAFIMAGSFVVQQVVGADPEASVTPAAPPGAPAPHADSESGHEPNAKHAA